ncbi:MAG TPA: Maf family protein, partial [Ottowia sp.]|uniref:Maf family protein n=1 Tax=Ottowia sp. TaxID=1898956 RepID=UPI002C4A41A6
MTTDSTGSASARALVLGSTSRYRRELLTRLGLPFTTEAPGVDETPQKGESPRDLAVRLALAKARDVARRHPQAIVIGS